MPKLSFSVLEQKEDTMRLPRGTAYAIFLKMLAAETDECIVWPYGKQHAYGQIVKPDGAMIRIHREAYRLTKGPIPDGQLICHSCDNPPCFNPRHLFAGTNQDNQTDMANKGRSTRGVVNPRALLTPDDVRQIRQLYQAGSRKHGPMILGQMFGVSKWAIRHIIKGRNWREVV